MGVLATLTFDLLANSAKLNSEFAKAAKSSKSWAKQTRATVNGVGKFIAASSLASSLALGAVYTANAQAIDQLAKTSDKLGLTTDSLIGLQYAGEITGVSINTMNMALQRSTRRIAEAAQGTGEAKGALKELGLEAVELAKLSPDEQFDQIAGAMARVSNQGDRVRLAMKLFDSEGVALVNTLALGSSGLHAMRSEANELGITFSRIDAAKVEQANDSFARGNAIMSAFGKRLAIETAPIVTAVSSAFVESAKEAGGFGQIAERVLSAAATGVGVMADGVHGLRIGFVGLQLVSNEVWRAIIRGAVMADRAITDLINKMPGVNASYSAVLQTLGDSTAAVAEQTRAKMDALLLEPLPSERIKTFIADAQAKAQLAAEEVAANSPAAKGACWVIYF